MSMELSLVEAELGPIIDKAKSLVISSPEDMIMATSLLSAMNKIMDSVTAEKEKITRPLLDALAVERGRWKPIEDSYRSAIEPLRIKISDYQTQQRRSAEERLKSLSEEVLSGKTSIDSASKELSSLSQSKDRVDTPMGKISFREQKVLRIVNKALVPRKYWKIDEELVFDVLKSGTKVKGAEIEIIQVPVNRR